MNPPKKITVLIDTREQYPLLFPEYLRYDSKLIRVESKKQKLDEGDYCLEEDQEGLGVERKGAATELIGNLIGGDRRRALASLTRLSQEYRRPVLMVDAGITSFYRKEIETNGERTLCELFRQCYGLGIQPWFVGPCKGTAIRRRLGQTVCYAALEAWRENDFRR